MPVLRDGADGPIAPETTIIIEYLGLNHPGRTALMPADPERAWQTRPWDRFFDLYVAERMQTIVGDRLRPAGNKDPFGVQTARAQLDSAYVILDERMKTRTWAMGHDFTMADCAAAPALFYANMVEPIGEAYPNTAGYLDRLMQRPSFARVLAEAKPYLPLFPRA
jgi:glutathione S-transferase